MQAFPTEAMWFRDRRQSGSVCVVFYENIFCAHPCGAIYAYYNVSCRGSSRYRHVDTGIWCTRSGAMWFRWDRRRFRSVSVCVVVYENILCAHRLYCASHVLERQQEQQLARGYRNFWKFGIWFTRFEAMWFMDRRKSLNYVLCVVVNRNIFCVHPLYGALCI